MDKKQADELIAEIRAVKKLLILQLLRADVPQKQIASMLEISEATMSRMIPSGSKGAPRLKGRRSGVALGEGNE